LLEAIDRFDPRIWTRFETFASHRISGAILSGVETLSEKQQQIAVRKRVRAERAKSLADGAKSKAATEGVDALKLLADVAAGLALGFLLYNPGLYLDGDSASGDTPYERLEVVQLRQRVTALVGRLPTPERKVIHAHYFQHLPFEEIAQQLGLSKGRVSQIHHAALQRLRAMNECLGRLAVVT
jgi:RNA polymerase sigma factor FliA